MTTHTPGTYPYHCDLFEAAKENGDYKAAIANVTEAINLCHDPYARAMLGIIKREMSAKHQEESQGWLVSLWRKAFPGRVAA